MSTVHTPVLGLMLSPEARKPFFPPKEHGVDAMKNPVSVSHGKEQSHERRADGLLEAKARSHGPCLSFLCASSWRDI